MTEEIELKAAKGRLYGLLLEKHHLTRHLSDTEVEIMFYLACDSQIQEMLRDNLHQRKPEATTPK